MHYNLVLLSLFDLEFNLTVFAVPVPFWILAFCFYLFDNLLWLVLGYCFLLVRFTFICLVSFCVVLSLVLFVIVSCPLLRFPGLSFGTQQR